MFAATSIIRRGRTTLGLVGVEQGRAGPPPQGGRDLPGEVEGVDRARVEPVPAPRRVEVGGVAHEEHPAPAVAGRQQHPRGPRVAAEHLDVDVVADPREASHEPGRVVAVSRVDALHDRPPAVGHVEPAEHAADLTDDPVLHGRGHPHSIGEFARAEHDVEVRARRRGALHRDAEALAHRRGPAVGADDVVGADPTPPTVGVAHGDDRLFGVGVRHPVDPKAEKQQALRLPGDRLPQHLFDERLRDLLADLGGVREAVGVELEGVAKAAQLVPVDAGAEDDVLGVVDRQRCRCADLVGHAERAQHRHGPGVGRLGPRAVGVDVEPRLDDDGRDAAPREVEGGHETGRSASGDDDGCVLGQVRDVRGGAAGHDSALVGSSIVSPGSFAP